MNVLFVFSYICLVWASLSGEVKGEAHPELSEILSKLDNGENMHSALKLVKEAKMGGSWLKSMSSFSPLFSQLLTEIGRKSPKLNALIDVTEGQMPTLKDLYHLIAPGSSTSSNTIKDVLTNNKQFQELSSLMNNKDFEHSKADIERSIFILTGHNLDLSSAMIRDPTSGTYTLTTSHENKYRNVVDFFLFIHDNWNKFINILEMTSGDLNHVDKILESVVDVHLDFSNLIKISGLPTDGQKYSVATKGIDPRVTEILQLEQNIQTDFKNSNNIHAFELQMEVFVKVFNLMNLSLHQALSAGANTIG